MNILITGGAGFIGLHLAEYHLQKKDRVWVIDSLLTGRQENIASLLSHPNFLFHPEKIEEGGHVQEAVDWADCIYHMAAIVGQKYVVTHPIEVLSTNIDICNRIIQLAAKTSHKPKILIASSAEVYGVGKQGFQEDAIIEVKPREYRQRNYAMSKIINEMTALSYFHSKGLPCVIARIFNTIGPHQTGQYGMVVPSFIQQALHRQPITIYGDGKQTRCFCPIQEMVRALDLLMQTPNCIGKIINVGSQEEISIVDLAHLILHKTKSPSTIYYLPYKEAYGIEFVDVPRRVPSLDLVQTLTGFTSQVSLDEAITEIISSIRLKGP